MGVDRMVAVVVTPQTVTYATTSATQKTKTMCKTGKTTFQKFGFAWTTKKRWVNLSPNGRDCLYLLLKGNISFFCVWQQYQLNLEMFLVHSVSIKCPFFVVHASKRKWVKKSCSSKFESRGKKSFTLLQVDQEFRGQREWASKFLLNTLNHSSQYPFWWRKTYSPRLRE